MIPVKPVFPETRKPFSGWLASFRGGRSAGTSVWPGCLQMANVRSEPCEDRQGHRQPRSAVGQFRACLCLMWGRGGGGGSGRSGTQSDSDSTVLGHCSFNTRHQQQEDVGRPGLRPWWRRARVTSELGLGKRELPWVQGVGARIPGECGWTRGRGLVRCPARAQSPRSAGGRSGWGCWRRPLVQLC